MLPYPFTRGTRHIQMEGDYYGIESSESGVTVLSADDCGSLCLYELTEYIAGFELTPGQSCHCLVSAIDLPDPPSLTVSGVSKVRIQHNGMGQINIMEVEVYSEGNNVALQGTAELSSTVPVSPGEDWNFAAFTTIDGDASDIKAFAHSNVEDGAYLEIDLGQVYDVESVRIFNRPTHEGRLSDSTVTLRSPSDEVLYTYEIGDASSLSTIDISASDFFPRRRLTPESSARNMVALPRILRPGSVWSSPGTPGSSSTFSIAYADSYNTGSFGGKCVDWDQHADLRIIYDCSSDSVPQFIYTSDKKLQVQGGDRNGWCVWADGGTFPKLKVCPGPGMVWSG
ncbi:hypothetical protein THAOC_27897, partial [Thalassiosira oceanica]